MLPTDFDDDIVVRMIDVDAGSRAFKLHFSPILQAITRGKTMSAIMIGRQPD